MKLTIEQNALAQVLTAVTGIIERRNTIPILSNVLVTAFAGQFEVRGTDLDIEMTSKVAADIEDEGRTTVSAGMLLDIVKRLDKGKIVNIKLDDQYLHVSSGRSRFKLQTLDADDFPIMADNEYDHSVDIEGRKLADMFDKTKFAMSNEETRYYLNGVYLHNDPETGNILSVATDGHRLAKYTMSVDAQVNNIIVPRKTVLEVTKLADIDDDVTIETSQHKVRFTGPGFVLTSKVIDGSFPDYTRVIPSGNHNEMTVSAKDFSGASGRVALVSDDRIRAVRLTVSDGLCALSVMGMTGEAKEDIEVQYDGPDFETGFNSKYLAEMMSQAEGGAVTMLFGDPGGPALVLMSDVPEFVGVVMPVRM